MNMFVTDQAILQLTRLHIHVALTARSNQLLVIKLFMYLFYLYPLYALQVLGGLHQSNYKTNKTSIKTTIQIGEQKTIIVKDFFRSESKWI